MFIQEGEVEAFGHGSVDARRFLQTSHEALRGPRRLRILLVQDDELADIQGPVGQVGVVEVPREEGVVSVNAADAAEGGEEVQAARQRCE